MNAENLVMQVDCWGRPVGLINTAWPVITHAHASEALASVAAVANTHHVVTGIDVSTDLDGALVTIKEDTTTKWQLNIGDASAVSPIYRKFPTEIVLAANKTCNLAINGTTACKANLFGYSIKVKS